MSDLIHSLVLSLRETAAEINSSCINTLVKESVPEEGLGSRAFTSLSAECMKITEFYL